MTCFRRLLHVSGREQTTNDFVLNLVTCLVIFQELLFAIAKQQKLKLFGNNIV